ncbi:ABC transporter ATP-binding protein [Leifsonia sp. 21MFCrub1.1]|uniref:ABC transporter ATP-binding protein n=1 Tax=Leifsonia sp. 21MFCrub1.1 TaxID=1798223 RepID=UPI0008929F0E|nr:ABC transporter ATP-binding protein [Leifsonia sp. 21MFCrub1.1]SEA72782.1 putative ABC transport system ATP-binding protein [Leifsonia sp. 21MFCrub1.1]
MNDALIGLDAVTKIFPGPPAVEVLHPTDLAVEQGGYASIVGPSGSGKSTLLNLLGLLDRPTTGEYRFDGVPTTELADEERARLRARSIGFVFQSFHLIPERTVLENVLLSTLYSGVARAERVDLARNAIERVGLGHRVDHTPLTLSGGERQRVAVARATMTSPKLLLADEPTGNLDQNTSGQVMDLFEELNADGMAVVIITHDAAVAKRARRVIRIVDGAVEDGAVEDGTVEER